MITPEVLGALAFFVFGLLMGSFGNVIIHRLPLGESIVKPRSRCPHCKKMVGAGDNVPVLSYLFLRGRCRHCRKPISMRYPFVEIVTGLLFSAIYLRLGLTFSMWEALYFGWAAVVCSFIDMDHRILPNEFTLSGIVIGLAGAALNPERVFLDGLFGFLIGGGLLWAVAAAYMWLRNEEGMGGGDIKLIAWIGATFGVNCVVFSILVSSILGSILGLSLAFIKRTGLKTSIPFGPYLFSAALLYVFGGSDLIQFYLAAMQRVALWLGGA